MDKYNLIIAGVGGQGVILAGNIIGEVALAAGYDVKKTDTLGMAQRGGSVVSHLRLAPRVFSPLIKVSEADILVALEKLEAARWSRYLKPDGIAIVNDQALPPLSVSAGRDKYPADEEITGIIEQRTGNYHMLKGAECAARLGNIKALNVFMLGCLARFLPFEDALWRDSITKNLPQKVVKLNISAFEQGRKAMQEELGNA